MTSCLTVGFLGSGSFAATCLRLISRRVTPLWVVTSAPKPAGRGMKECVTPVQAVAQELEIDFFTTFRISQDEERMAWIKSNLPDVILVIDFGHIIKEPLLSMPRLGCLNIHPSLLPAYRGSAPVQRAILDGLDRTGVTIFRLDAGMDSGPILARQEVMIGEEDTSGSILNKCAAAGSALLLECLCEISAENWQLQPQPSEGVSLAPKINKAEAKIDWNASARAIFSRVRAMNPAPMAYADFKGKRLKIISARPLNGCGRPGTLVGAEDGLPLIACGEGILQLLRVQPEGKSEQGAADWLRGARIKQGDTLY